MNNPSRTVYEEMSRKRLEIAAAQIDVLSYYDHDNREKRMQEVYDVSHEALVDNPSETAIEALENLIRLYSSEIAVLREKRRNPFVEDSEEFRKKLQELEALLSQI